MNIKEYISSGIIESYVLGMVTEAERQEFEARCEQYPEILAARNAFELALEQQLLSDAPSASPALKLQIQNQITGIETSTQTIQDLKERAPVRRMGLYKWLAAASFILLLGAAFWAFQTNQEYNRVLAQNHELQDRLAQSSAHLDSMKADQQMLTKPGMKMAALKGTDMAPGALATVFWDTTSSTKEVYLLINNLPQPPSSQQYQLWAILNNQPLDLGLIDQKIRQNRLILRMKNVQQAQAFAITLEPRGGSPEPTGPMYVQGQIQ